MSTELATVQPHRYSAEQRQLILETCCGGASEHEAAALIGVAEARGMNPLAGECYFVKRWDGAKGKNTWAVQASIDSFRIKAEQSGLYAGQDEPEFEYNAEGGLMLARVKVYRKDWGDRACVGVARWDEYVQTTKDGKPTRFWSQMPHNQLAKCFDQETEVLTDIGFQLFSEVTGNILQVTDEGLELTASKPFSQLYDGEMIAFLSDDINFCVTPNHDMVTTVGKVEARIIYEESVVRPKFRIPRIAPNARHDAPISDETIVLAAAYLCDGTDSSNTSFIISVSRPRKIELLNSLQLHASSRNDARSGDIAISASGREIITHSDKTSFRFQFSSLGEIAWQKKQINTTAILAMSQRQARLFVDSMIAFDGHRDAKSRVRRFYSSRPHHIKAIELAAVVAGYAVSVAKSRTSDIGTRLNYYLTVSDRNEVPISRWRHKRSDCRRKHRSLEVTTNKGGKVWCASVPSGKIVVRRKGFSMVCGNCAEALALRKAFPAALAKIYTAEEMAQADNEPLVREEAGAKLLPAMAESAASRLGDANTEDELKEAWRFVAVLRKQGLDDVSFVKLEKIKDLKKLELAVPQEPYVERLPGED